MTPEEANAFAAIVEGVDDAGGRIRGTEIDHEQAVTGLASLFGASETRPVFTLEIVADPDEVLNESDEDNDNDEEGAVEDVQDVANSITKISFDNFTDQDGDRDA